MWLMNRRLHMSRCLRILGSVREEDIEVLKPFHGLNECSNNTVPVRKGDVKTGSKSPDDTDVSDLLLLTSWQ